MLIATQVDWDAVGRLWGPLGIVFVLAVLVVLAILKLAQKLVMGTIEDARKERDYVRQQREREADKFIESLKVRDELMRDGFDEVLREIRDTRRK